MIPKKLKKEYSSIFIFLILMSLSLCVCVTAEGINWECQITVNVSGETASNFVIFGEAAGASDGPPADSYDAPKSPTPPSPYVHAYFDDGLEYPYNILTSDYRHYCDGVAKQWNLTIKWDLLSYPETINLTWSSSDLTSSPYDSMYLRDGEGTILVDMYSVELYAFTVSSMGSQDFLISCENASCGGSDDGQDNLGDDDDDFVPGDDDDDYVPGDDDDDLPSGGNQPPIPQISVNNQTGLIGSTFYFSGKESSDDGLIQSYEWDLGNGITKSGVNTTAVYNFTGEYTVVLTVTDDQGISASDSLKIHVIKGNLPPTIAITGPEKGSQNQNYSFSIQISDPNENDNVRYVLDWDDESDQIVSDFTDQKTITLNHSWKSYGVFMLSVYAEDQDLARSSTNYFNFSVDVLLVHGEISGYLYDEDSDGLYDGFHIPDQNKNVEVTSTADSTYSFQMNNKMYEINTNSSMSSAVDTDQSLDDKQQSSFTFNGMFLLIGIILIMIIALIIYLVKYS